MNPWMQRSTTAKRWPQASLRLVLSLCLTGCGALGQTENITPLEQARRGGYADASVSLEAMVAGGDTSAEVVESLYYSWIRQGEYSHALDRFEDLATGNPNAGPIRLAAARANRLTGNYDRSLAHLEAILNFADVGVAARVERAEVLDQTGRRDESRQIYADLIEGFQDGIIRAPAQMIYIARTMWAEEYFQDANDVFKLIARANPRDAEAFLAWGDLLAEKFNAPEALSSYEDALGIDPNMPEAHLGVARVHDDPETVGTAIERALEVNPNFIEAHLLRAEQRIDAEQYDEADEEIDKALAINPRLPAALALAATTHFLRNETSDFDRAVAEVLEINPEYGEMFYILAQRCVNLRLYEQAVAFAREAIRLNPRYWLAHNLLAINLMRIGEEVEGKAILETAYDNDPFNVWTVNTLTLLDSFDNFDRFESEHFRIMLHKEESGVLEPYVRDLLEEAYTTLSSKYGFEPDFPITFEMFPDHEDFAVRTLGLPGLGALGVCFGKVVVMDSPSARPPESFNWGSTLWHEFAHVITLQITDHKIPRWFSEGISVYEERKAVPGWGDDLRMDYLVAARDGQFLPIADLNNGFIRPKNPGQVSLSYYQASLICDYIEEKYGFGAIRQMLALYKEGADTAEVFERALATGLAAFDDSFHDWVNERIAAIDLEEFQRLMARGQEAFEAEDLDGAIEALSSAVEAYPEYSDEHNPYETLAEAYIRKGDTRAAIETLTRFLSYSESAYDAYLKLARLMIADGDPEGALGILERALFIHPLDLEGHRELGAIFLEDERFDSAAREYEALLALNAPDQADTYFRLASAQYGDGKLAEARKSILRCLEIAPSFEAGQELLLKIVRFN